MKVWILLTGTLDDGSVPNIHGVYATKDLAYDEFMKQLKWVYRNTKRLPVAPSIADDEIYADNSLDFIQLVEHDVVTQPAITT